MPSASIIRHANPEGPSDVRTLRREFQEKRTDPEAELLREFLNCESPYPTETPENKKFWDEKVDFLCERLGGISFDKLLHKFDIFVGRVDDDECDWREQKYGKQ